jgi:hypothetical protein
MTNALQVSSGHGEGTCGNAILNEAVDVMSRHQHRKSFLFAQWRETTLGSRMRLYINPYNPVIHPVSEILLLEIVCCLKLSDTNSNGHRKLFGRLWWFTVTGKTRRFIWAIDSFHVTSERRYCLIEIMRISVVSIFAGPWHNRWTNFNVPVQENTR